MSGYEVCSVQRDMLTCLRKGYVLFWFSLFWRRGSIRSIIGENEPNTGVLRNLSTLAARFAHLLDA